MPEPIPEFDGYTDDTAPGDGRSLKMASTTVLSLGLVLLKVLTIRSLSDSAVGSALARVQGAA